MEGRTAYSQAENLGKRSSIYRFGFPIVRELQIMSHSRCHTRANGYPEYQYLSVPMLDFSVFTI